MRRFSEVLRNRQTVQLPLAPSKTAQMAEWYERPPREL